MLCLWSGEKKKDLLSFTKEYSTYINTSDVDDNQYWAGMKNLNNMLLQFNVYMYWVLGGGGGGFKTYVSLRTIFSGLLANNFQFYITAIKKVSLSHLKNNERF